MLELSESVNRKFVDIIDVSDFEIETDSGWSDIGKICKTIPYEVWELTTEDGHSLRCADDHIVFLEGLSQIFVADCSPGDKIITSSGISAVKTVKLVGGAENMYDVQVNDANHRYWTGGVLSHNTTIINAICYALYNKPLDNISLQRLINSTNASKNTLMEIRLSFDKGDDEFEIYRCRGETFDIQITMNGEDITLDSVSENDKLVVELIGMSYDLFTKIVVFSGNSTPFLMTPVAQQRQQIEELFNITLLTEKALKLKDIIKQTEADVSVQEAIIKEQESQVALFQAQVRDAQRRVDRWEADRVTQISDLRRQLELLHSVNMDEEKELHELLASIEKDISGTGAQLSVQQKEHAVLSSDVKKLSGELSHLLDDKCPYCLQQYAGASDKLAEKQTLLEKRTAQLEMTASSIQFLRDTLSELQSQQESARAVIKFSSLSDALRAESSAATAQEKITTLEVAINPHTEALESLHSTAVQSVSYEKLDVLKKDVEHQAFLLKLLTDKNSFIRRNIINRTIPFLNSRLNFYTKELGLPHIVKFDDDMGCVVSEFGRELDFGNLSSGEKKRVNMALSMAFRDVLHQLHARVNCLFVDEIDASLDGNGVEAVFKLLKSKSRDDGLGVWIISHRPEATGRFDRTIIIRKENGFAKIVDEEGVELEMV
jgi:hypothetical protein